MSIDQGIHIIKLFVSSPDDVRDQRRRVEAAVDKLNRVYAPGLRFDVFFWENNFYSADETWQAQIPQVDDYDIVIVIFWSKLGSPLPDSFRNRLPDRNRYPTGSAYEMMTAIEARQRSGGGRPDVYLFYRPDAPVCPLDQDNARMKAQWFELRDFLSPWLDPTLERGPLPHYAFGPEGCPEEKDLQLQVEKLLRGWISAHIVDRSVIWPIAEKKSPFPGLQPYDARHASVYFGRDRKVERAVLELKRAAREGADGLAASAKVPFLLIVGESGAGKSSMMRAGIAPRLTTPGALAEVDYWRIAVARMGDEDPFRTVANALFVGGHEGDDPGGFGPALPEIRIPKSPEAGAAEHKPTDLLAHVLRTGAPRDAVGLAPAALPLLNALDEAAEKERRRRKTDQPVRTNLLLLVDQLENIFTEDVPLDDRSAFARLLLALCATRRIWVIATLNVDLYAEAIKPGDFIALTDRGAQYNLAAPGDAELAEIVRAAPAAAGLTYEVNAAGTGLGETILADAQENALPLVQFALHRLFEYKQEVDGSILLTFDAYRKIGGIYGAIDKTAEEALSTAGEEREAETARLPRLLRILVVPVSDGSALSARKGELTIRAAPIGKVIPEDDAVTRKLVDKLVNARILVTSEIAGEGDSKIRIVRIAHQRVIERWERARSIIEDKENEFFFQTRRDVEVQRTLWEAFDRRPEHLIVAEDLLEKAKRLVSRYEKELDEQTQDFVTLSVAASARRQRDQIRQQQRRIRELVGAAAALAILLIAVGVAAVIAVLNEERATRNYEAARKTVGGLIDQLAAGMRSVDGMPWRTINTTLNSSRSLLDTLEKESSNDPLLKDIRASMYFEFAKVYQNAEEPDEARQAALQSLNLRRDLAGHGPTDGARWNLAMSLDQVGDIERRPDPNSARRRYEDAQAIRRGLKNGAPESSQFACGLSFSFIRLGDMDADARDALGKYEGSLREMAEVAGRQPDRIEDCDWDRELSWAYDKLGQAYDKLGMTDMALENYGKAICLRRFIAERSPTELDLRRDVAYTIERMGRSYSAKRNWTAADDAFMEVIGIRRDVMTRDPDRVLWQLEYARSLNEFGGILRPRRPDLALALAERGADARRQAVNRLLNDPRKLPAARAALAESEKIVSEMAAQLDPGQVAGIRLRRDDIINSALESSSERRTAALRDTAECRNDLLANLNGAAARK